MCVCVCVCVCVRKKERERERERERGICVGGCGLLACVNARNVRNTEKGIHAMFYFFRRAFKYIRKNYNSHTLRKAHASTIRY